jgi:hypothetical protein
MVEPGEVRVLETSTLGDGEVPPLAKNSVLERGASRGALPEEHLAQQQALHRLRQRALAAEELLTATLPLTDEWLTTLRWKASSSQHFRFAGQLLPLLSGAAFLSDLSQSSASLRYLLGLLTFLSSIVGLVSQHTERTLLQGRTASELLPQIVEARALGERLRRELRIWRQAGHDLEHAQELLHQANDVAYRLNTLGPLIGGSAWRKLTQHLETRLQGPVRA